MSEDRATRSFDDAIREFERMIDHADVSVATDEDELLAEFESIVERYDAVRSDLEGLRSERPTDGDGGFTTTVFVTGGPTERWRDRHPEHVAEITQPLAECQAVFEQVDTTDPDVGLTEGADSEVGALLDEITVRKTSLEPADE